MDLVNGRTEIFGTMTLTPARAEMQDLVHAVDLAVDRRDRQAGGPGLDVVPEQLVELGLRAKNSADRV